MFYRFFITFCFILPPPDTPKTPQRYPKELPGTPKDLQVPPRPPQGSQNGVKLVILGAILVTFGSHFGHFCSTFWWFYISVFGFSWDVVGYRGNSSQFISFTIFRTMGPLASRLLWHPCPTRMPVHGNSKTALIDVHVQEFPKKNALPVPLSSKVSGQPFLVLRDTLFRLVVFLTFLDTFRAHFDHLLDPKSDPKWRKNMARKQTHFRRALDSLLSQFWDHWPRKNMQTVRSIHRKSHMRLFDIVSP